MKLHLSACLACLTALGTSQIALEATKGPSLPSPYLPSASAASGLRGSILDPDELFVPVPHEVHAFRPHRVGTGVCSVTKCHII
jgi:hypothetical protein